MEEGLVSADLAAVLNELTARPGFPLSPEAVRRACATLGVDGAAVTLAHSGPPPGELLWASGETAESLEELQFTLNEGACMEAAMTGSPVLIPDLHHSTEVQRWPVFAATVARMVR